MAFEIPPFLNYDIPILKGVMLMAVSQGDIKKELSLAVIFAVIVLALLEVIGFNGGVAATSLISAFTLILGYWFGRKEEEAKQKPGLKAT